MVPYELSKSAFAKHIGWPQPKLNEIITGKRRVSPATAMVFSDAFGTTPEFWLNLQNAVDLWRAEQKHKVVARLVSPTK